MKISIIIPIYNGAKFIVKCFDSIYNQELKNDSFEIIAINDGSTDETEKLITQYSEGKDNIILVNKENGGVSTARNLGIEVAKGEFVLFLDVDDELINGSLLKVYNYLCENSTIDMLVTRQSRFDGTTERVVGVEKMRLKEDYVYTGVETYQHGYVRGTAGGAICRTGFLREKGLHFPTCIKNGEDTLFFGLVHVYAQKITLFDIVLYRINEISGSASRTNYDKLGLSIINTLNKAIEIRNSLKCEPEQKGVMEYVVYRILSMLTFTSIKSERLSYLQLRKSINFKELLPFKTRYMYIMRGKAQLINISYCLFYFLSRIHNSDK